MIKDSFREGGRVKQRPLDVTKEELNNIKLLSVRNQVILKIEKKNLDKKSTAGLIIIADDDFDPVAHANRVGVVFKLPPSIYFNKKSNASLVADTDMELEIGDEVLFSFFESENGLKLKCDGDLYCFVRYDKCYAKRKNGVVTALNGYVFFEPVFEPKSRFEIYDHVDKRLGKVYLKGSMNRDYSVFNWRGDDFDVEVGDVCSFRKVGNEYIQYYIENDLHRDFFDRKLFVKHRQEINGILHNAFTDS